MNHFYTIAAELHDFALDVAYETAVIACDVWRFWAGAVRYIWREL